MMRILFAASFFLAFQPTSALAQQAEPLFLRAPSDALAPVAPDPTFANDALVAVRVELLDGVSAIDAAHPLALVLELELGQGDVALFDTRSVLGSGAVAFLGTLRDAAQSQVILVQRGGVVSGTVRDGARLYKLNWAGAGWHRIARVDESLFPTCATNAAHSISAGKNPVPPNGGYLVNLAPTIDVMVVYTPLAAQNAGGTVAMEDLIDLAVLESNQAYFNSQVNQRLRLVHQEALTGYVEHGDFNTELNRLTSTSDGFFDHIHALRDQYGADEVAMLVDSTQYCGIGWLMTNLSSSFQDHAFMVTSKQCATGYYSFAHEFGHNMGSHHDHANASGALYPYSYGYRTASGNYRTIMAYAPGTRIQFFSNPNVNYQSEVLGIASGGSAADNARSLNNTAATVAQFRCAIPELYGTGKPTSLGTTPALSWTSTPSAASNNFRVRVSGGMPNKVGLVFRGTQPAALPFLGGTLWVGGVITRLPPLVNDAAGSADFAFPLSSFSVGDVTYAQHWGRDPQHPDG
ncbi:MAG TPA: M12 family metallo-peptidase, partial [Planctomycetota bacterium]|nr:M12 family metallo-peptidase [Planctomycetota bacterium]